MQKMGYLCNVIQSSKPGILMVVGQMVYAGMNILYKLVSENGVNLRILIAYRMLFATAFMVPLALIFERCCSSNTYIKAISLGQKSH